jgi:hypothetical protein
VQNLSEDFLPVLGSIYTTENNKKDFTHIPMESQTKNKLKHRDWDHSQATCQLIGARGPQWSEKWYENWVARWQL